MVIKIIDADIITAARERAICHQVNCCGVMGSGVARAIAKQYPDVYRDYREACEKSCSLLGTILPVYCDGCLIINMFSQDGYGHGKRYTNYEAFYTCLESIRQDFPCKLAFPYEIGCGLGGGNWKIISMMIEEVVGDMDVAFYRFRKS